MEGRLVTATDALAAELLRLTEQGVRVPCHGSDEWTSDDADDRAYAAALCQPCTVLMLCGQAADELKVTYVWGGTDRTPPPAKRRPTDDRTTDDDGRRPTTADERRTDRRRTTDGVGRSQSLRPNRPDHFAGSKPSTH